MVMTSAGDPTSPAGKLIERARLSPAWYVREMPGPLPWVAPGDLAEQRAELSEAMFARLHENRWVAAEDRLVNPEDLAACVTLDGPLDPRPGVQYRIGVDLGVKHDSTVVAVCHSEPVGDARRVVLDRMLTYTGRKLRPVSLDAVEAAVASAAKTYNRAHDHRRPVAGGRYVPTVADARTHGRGVHVQRQFGRPAGLDVASAPS